MPSDEDKAKPSAAKDSTEAEKATTAADKKADDKAAESKGSEEKKGDSSTKDDKASPAKPAAEDASDDESDSDDVQVSRKSKKQAKKKKKSRMIDDEAALSGSDSGDDEDGGKDTYEADGFVVDKTDGDAEEEEGSATDSESDVVVTAGKKRRKRRRASHDSELEDDDLELLKENTGKDAGEVQRRRLKKSKTDQADANIGPAPTTAPVADLDAVERALFGDEAAPDAADKDEEVPDEEARKKAAAIADDEFSEDEDDLGDFMVDDDDDELTHEERMERKRQRRAARKAQQAAAFGAGIDVDMLEDARDIFGDGTLEDIEMLDAEMGFDEEEAAEDEAVPTDQADPAAAKKARQKKQLDVIRSFYEPSVLQSLYLSDADEQVKMTDIPERLQYAYANRSKMTEHEELEDIDNEASWMFHRITEPDHALTLTADERTQRSTAIKYVLQYLRQQHLEVPFIHEHRKDYYKPLDEQNLWDIFKYDQQWATLQRRSSALLQLVTTIELPEEATFRDLLKDAVEADLDADAHLHDSLYAETIGDLAAYFTTLVGEEVRTTKRKLPVKRYSLAEYERTGKMDYVNKIGITANQLAQNIQAGFATERMEDPDKDVTELCKDFLSVRVRDPEVARRNGRAIAAQLIATHPIIRRHLRKVFRDQATITTRPTRKGLSSLNPYTATAAVAWLTKKPIRYMLEQKDRHQYLTIVKAEKDGYISSEVSCDTQNILDELKDLYLSVDTSEKAKGWNDEREHILKTVLDSHLIPLFVKEARSMLLRDSSDCIADQVFDIVSSKLMQAPFVPAQSLDDDDDMMDDMSDRTRVVGILLTPQQITVLVALDAYGQVIDHLHLKFMRDPTHLDKIRKQQRMDDVEKFKKFIKAARPRLLAIVPSSMQSKNLYIDIRQYLTEIDPEGSKYDIVFSPADVAVPYHVSETARKEFPDYDDNMRKIISVARRQQDPVAEMARLCNSEDDILNLYIHPLQGLLPPGQLKAAVTRAFSSVVNKIGVSVADIANYPHLANHLQFVAGLGPRKAAALQSSLRKLGTRIRTRVDLLEKNLLGPVVYTNACATLRFDSGGLDGTRIHPEDYTTAMQIAVDALEIENVVDSRMSNYIEQAMLSPEKVEDLDLDAYADRLEQSGKGRFREKLYTIKDEIRTPYQDIRRPFARLSDNELFTLLTGETEETLTRGQVVSATVVKVNPSACKLRLESGVIGWLRVDNISDKHVAEAGDRCRVGQVVQCRVLAVDKERMTAELSSRASDLSSTKFEEELLRDEFYQVDPNYGRNDKARKVQKFIPRPITHLAFANVDRVKAEEKLADQTVGTALFRPSSQGVNNLTLTWKFLDHSGTAVYRHDSIVEKQKHPANPTELGAILELGNEEYEDLDEILARFVEPCTDHVRELTGQKFYKSDSYEDVKEMLTAEKKAAPKRIPYFICPAPGKPGYFVLAFQPRENSTKKEYVGVTPGGFRYRHQTFPTTAKLIAFFKKNALTKPPSGGLRAQSRPHSRRRTDPRRDPRTDPRTDPRQDPRADPDRYAGGRRDDRRGDRYNDRGYDDRRRYDDRDRYNTYAQPAGQ